MKELKEKLKIWNSILIETGNYQDLEIEGVKNCLGLADYILDFFLSEGNADMSISLFIIIMLANGLRKNSFCYKK